MENNKLAKTNIHQGHRSRVREKLLSNTTFDSMLDHELLEFLLFQSVPQGDTNSLSHKLIDKFGSFNNVLEASAYELMQVDGIGKVTALHLASFLAVTKRYLLGTLKPKPVFESTSQIIEYFQALCMGNKYECAYALYLDKSKRLIKYEKLSEGGIDSTGIYIDKIVQSAILFKAYYVVLGHNHTSGNTFPSPWDIESTERLLNALIGMKKFLLDSVIVDHLSAYSMLDNGVISNNNLINPFKNGANVRIDEQSKFF